MIRWHSVVVGKASKAIRKEEMFGTKYSRMDQVKSVEDSL